MAVQFKAMLACLFTLLAIMHTVSGGEYCCPYYTSYGTYKPLRYCSTYCCGTSTNKYCCDSLWNRYFPSYSSSSLCPTRPTTTTVRTVGSGEYCCAYYTSSGSYKSSFYCSKYCCGTSASKYCCDSFLNRYYPSYSYRSLCPAVTSPTTTTGEYCCAYYTSSGSYRSSFHCSKYCCGTSTSKYCCTSSYSRYYGSYSYVSSCPTPSNNWSSWASSTTSGIINVTGAIVGSVVGFIALCVIIGVVICCATGCCGQRRGTVTRPPGNGIVMMNTPPTTQGYPVGYAPPPNTAYGPGIPQPNAAYGPGTQPPYTGYGPGIPPQQPPNTEFGPGIPPPQPPNTGFGPGIPPPNNPFGPGSPPNAEAAPLDAAKGAGNDAPPPPYPGTDNTYTPLQP
ncbi:protein shisa-5 [Lingula anatina]|uniref:Protein shisa-5 n=1 Tax=Lingula anatina TaxID=7574 RepID=A0A1S3IKS9_LINAN|nr:protein shisa-5 [Lingula anatina]|eukprot:XP_013398693.2 protein shisa-5 [Lingula anatina]